MLVQSRDNAHLAEGLPIVAGIGPNLRQSGDPATLCGGAAFYRQIDARIWPRSRGDSIRKLALSAKPIAFGRNEGALRIL